MKQFYTTLLFLCLFIIAKSQPVLQSFTISNGATMYANVVQAVNGKLYGTMQYVGNTYNGSIFSFDPATSAHTKLKDFNYFDGSKPNCCLLPASDGKLYGTTQLGGKYLGGVIFSFDPVTLVYKKLVDFYGIDGYASTGALMQAADGKLYGMTDGGGRYNYGVIFSFDPKTSVYTKLKDRSYNTGFGNSARLVQLSNGMLYGTTSAGGMTPTSTGKTIPFGVIFSFDPVSLAYTQLKIFDFNSDGAPTGSLLLAKDGKLYGTTSWGGSITEGVIYSFDPVTSTYKKLKDFGGDINNGRRPNNALLQTNDGKLYGTTSIGGRYKQGAVFSFDPVTSTYLKVKDLKSSGLEYDQLIEIPDTSAALFTSAFPINSFFPGSSVNVNYTTKKIFDTTNIFTAQLSDDSGSFQSPVNIGSITSPTNGTIACVIPDTTAFGCGYRIRVVSDNPNVNGTDNGNDITISQEPVAVYRINAGGGGIDNSIGTFAADSFYSPVPGNTYSTTEPVSISIPSINPLQTAIIYQTERYGTNGAFSYAFPVSNGNYKVVLHFAEIYPAAAGKRIFDVDIEGNKVLDSYDIFKKVGAFAATSETFPVNVTDSILNINFSSLSANGSVDQPKVSAIEIFATGANPAVTSFTLVNAADNHDIKTLINGSTINLANLPARIISIRANTFPAKAGSVVFNLDGAQSTTHTENIFPYTLFGDNRGITLPWTPPVGNYTLKATPYSDTAGSGTAGSPLLISFNVIDSVASSIARKAATWQETTVSKPNFNILKAFPNPGHDGHYTVSLSKQTDGQVAYTLLSATGARMSEGSLLLQKPTTILNFDFSREMRSSGIYFLQLKGKELNGQLKLVRLK